MKVVMILDHLVLLLLLQIVEYRPLSLTRSLFLSLHDMYRLRVDGRRISKGCAKVNLYYMKCDINFANTNRQDYAVYTKKISFYNFHQAIRSIRYNSWLGGC